MPPLSTQRICLEKLYNNAGILQSLKSMFGDIFIGLTGKFALFYPVDKSTPLPFNK
jgi:hypothetical protein